MNYSIFISKMPHPSRQGFETPLNKGFFKISSLPRSLTYLSHHLSHRISAEYHDQILMYGFWLTISFQM